MRAWTIWVSTIYLRLTITRLRLSPHRSRVKIGDAYTQRYLEDPFPQPGEVEGRVVHEMQPGLAEFSESSALVLILLRVYGISTCAWFEYLLCCPLEFTAAIT